MRYSSANAKGNELGNLLVWAGWETMVQAVCVICEEKRETRAACVPCLPEKGPSLRT